ncbi:hypothetical protein KC953_00480, partial [Candidatus Saccharibacteria bacterium]|nr:hypothetical protein [Candidatus Saccharibacteria bacterium]
MPTPQRLPIVNSDDGVWGDIIRQYLEKEHFNDDTDNPINGGHQKITIQPGTASAGTAPLKFTSGTLLTTPEAGAVEFNTDTLYLTQTTGTTRKKIAAYDDTSGATGDIYYRNSSGYFTRLGAGSTGDMLTISGGLPSWSSSIANTSIITIKDTNFTLQDDGNTTKQLKFELSSISASTTRTLTAPDANTTIVGTDVTQTLTNKTLTSPRIGTSLLDTNGNTMVSFTPTASAVVYLDIKNQAGGGAGTGPFLSPVGPNASHAIYIQAKGNNNTTSYIALGNSGYHAFKVMNTVTAGGNLLAVLPANAGGTPALTSAYSYSADANVGLDLQTKGTGVVQANGVEVATISGTQTFTNKTLTAPVVDGAAVMPQGTTITKYNTADQVTNYERLTEYWSANVYFIETSSGGTGIKRDIKINSGGQYLQLSATSTTKLTTFASSSLAGAKGIDVTGSFQASSSTQTALAVSPTIAQSATAGYTALLVNPTESATGSGTKLLADFQVGGTSKTRIDNTGSYYISSAASNGLTFYNTADETTNYEKVSIRYNSNVAEIGGYVAGTGVHRDLRIGINNSTYNPTNLYSYAQFSVSSTRIALRWATSASGLKMVSVGGGTDSLASASTIQNVLAIEPTVNQSGTAGYTGLLINPTETATGSGTKLLIDAQVGGVSKFSVDNTGVVTMAAVGTGAGSVVTVDGTQTLTNKTLTSPKIGTLYDNNGAIWLSVTPTAS